MRFRARTPAAAATVAASGTAPHPPKRRKARVAAPEEVATAPFAAEVFWGVVAPWGGLASACRRSVFVRARPLDCRRVVRSPAALGAVAVKPAVVAAVGAGSAACEEELPAAAEPVSGAGAAGAGAACLTMWAADPPETPSTMDVIVWRIQPAPFGRGAPGQRQPSVSTPLLIAMSGLAPPVIETDHGRLRGRPSRRP